MSDSPAEDVGARFRAFVALIARLRAPGGCPWDREQTHASLKPMTIEEAYEVTEAIDTGTDDDLAGELGDLLLQVVFHAQIAAEESRFDVGIVIDAVAEKMRRRHPHVFRSVTAGTSGEVLRNWEAQKQAERAAAGRSAPADSMLDSVSKALPAVMEGFQLSTKASRVGFDWPNAEAVLGKLDEELAELKDVLGAPVGSEAQRAHLADEMGDVLFSAVNVARLLGVDPETALKAANRKFRRRFSFVEERLREEGREPAGATLLEMEALWTEAKRGEPDRSDAP